MTAYTKHHSPTRNLTGYLVHTSKAAQGHQTATAFVYQAGAKRWVAEDWDGYGQNSTGTSRKAAMEAMYAARTAQAEADKDAEAAKPLRDSFYAEMDRLEAKGRFSTMYHALMSGLENADDTVGEGNVVADSAAYWELAWSGYESNKCEISEDDQALAEEHDLDDLARCGYCGRAVVDPQLYEDGHYCDECFEEVASEAVYGPNETLTDGAGVTFREGFSVELEGTCWVVKGEASTDPTGREFVVIAMADGASRLAWVDDLVLL